MSPVLSQYLQTLRILVKDPTQTPTKQQIACLIAIIETMDQAIRIEMDTNTDRSVGVFYREVLKRCDYLAQRDGLQ